MGELPDSLRVAFLAGTLGRGGAEKQLVYMARALQAAGVRVRVYTLGQHEFYEVALRDLGLAPTGVGHAGSPLLRLPTFAWALRRFRPHIIQAAHFYVNLYVALASRLFGSLDIGAIRSDVVLDLRGTGSWGPFLLRAPAALVANSHAARRTAVRLGVSSAKIHVVPNVIETSTPGLKGVVVGAGPERGSLEAHANRLGLLPDGLEFRGAVDDIPRLMAEADILALTSDNEGFPNVILEAMAARLPVITTPAGDAADAVEDGVSGFVVPFDAVEQLANRLVCLARAPTLRQELGEAGYARVNARYSCEGLTDRLLAVYRAVAQQTGHLHVLDRLPCDASVQTSPSRASRQRI